MAVWGASGSLDKGRAYHLGPSLMRCSSYDVRGCRLIGWTPLHEASNHGRVSVARELLRAGADSNAQGLDDNSPLHDAAINGHVEVPSLCHLGVTL